MVKASERQTSFGKYWYCVVKHPIKLKPAVLITGAYAIQNLPFLPQWWPKLSPVMVLIAPTWGLTRLSDLYEYWDG